LSIAGLYSASSTTAGSITEIILKALHDLDLDPQNLRGQGYDGAATMAGIHNGVQARIKLEYPLALFVHCGGHSTNLVTESTCEKCQLISDTLELVNDLGVLFKQSLTFREKFKEVTTNANNDEDPDETLSKRPKALRPLCPTRFTERTPAVRVVLDQLSDINSSLDELCIGPNTRLRSRAMGLSERLQKGSTALGLLLTVEIMELLEHLNTSIQGREMNVSSMIAAVKVSD
jgi:hypothetical protein